MNLHQKIIAIVPALRVRMQNNDWPAGRNQPDHYDLGVMNAGLVRESKMKSALNELGLGDYAQQSFCAYCQIHELVGHVWSDDRAYQLIQAILINKE